MNRHRKISLLAVAIATAGTVAYAAQGGMENDALSVSKAKIPLTRAVAAAEQEVNGKASQAKYENSKLGWVYDVEVVSGAKAFDVKVDAVKGSVISSAEDSVDHDDAHEKKIDCAPALPGHPFKMIWSRRPHGTSESRTIFLD